MALEGLVAAGVEGAFDAAGGVLDPAAEDVVAAGGAVGVPLVDAGDAVALDVGVVLEAVGGGGDGGDERFAVVGGAEVGVGEGDGAGHVELGDVVGERLELLGAGKGFGPVAELGGLGLAVGLGEHAAGADDV